MRQAWEAKKAEERADRGATVEASQMDGVARALPALIRAEKLQKRAGVQRIEKVAGVEWQTFRRALNFQKMASTY